MKLSKIASAAALLACGAAFAAPAADKIAYIAGASAVEANLRQALLNICVTNGGVWATPQIDPTNANRITYLCGTGALVGQASAAQYTAYVGKDFSATIPFQEIRLNIDAGSFSAIQQLDSVPLAYFQPGAAGPNTPVPATIVKLGGVLDVEPKAFPATTIGTLRVPPTQVLGVAQAFGVAASRPLYNAMYRAQRSAGAATLTQPIPSTCPAGSPAAANDATFVPVGTGSLECIPTISKGQMATIMADNPFNTANNLGAEFLAGATVAGTELGYARRVDTSGSQAAAQNYFLGLTCGKSSLNVVAQGAAGTTATSGTVPGAALRVYGLGSTGNVRTVLNDNARYSVGVISGENNQTAQNWLWLKVQGAAVGENSAPASAGITNREGVIKGLYDFYFETVFAPNPDNIIITGQTLSQSVQSTAFWGAVKTAINALVPPLGVGLIDQATLAAGYTKAGDTCLANSSN